MPKHLHSPLPASLRGESDKASQILEEFVSESWTGRPGKEIPRSVLANAKGLLILTAMRIGFMGSIRSGSGVAVVRLSDGSWSPPSAIVMAGIGGGGQFGAELTDFVFILNNASAVQTFAQTGSLTFGVNVSMAVGPVGRSAEFDGGAGLKGAATMYSYSKTKGLYGGLTVEIGLLVERTGANNKLYNRRVSVKELLDEEIAPPPEVEPLMRVLASEAFHHSDQHPRDVSETQPQLPAAAQAQPQPELPPETRTQPLSAPSTAVRAQTQPELATIPEDQPQPELHAGVQAQPLPEIPAQVQTQAPSELLAPVQAEPPSEPPVEAQARAQSELPADAQTQTPSELQATVQAQRPSESPAETQTQPLSELSTAVEAQPHPDLQAVDQAHPQSELPIEAQAQPSSELPAAVLVQPQSKSHVEAQNQPPSEAHVESPGPTASEQQEESKEVPQEKDRALSSTGDARSP